MQTELIEQIIHLPIAERVEIIERISRSLREDLRERDAENASIEARRAAVERLRNLPKAENPPMTKEETRETYYNRLAEKYK